MMNFVIFMLTIAAIFFATEITVRLGEGDYHGATLNLFIFLSASWSLVFYVYKNLFDQKELINETNH